LAVSVFGYSFKGRPQSIRKKLDADLSDERRAVIGTPSRRRAAAKGEIVGSCTVFLA
jgi:hypothetical protein